VAEMKCGVGVGQGGSDKQLTGHNGHCEKNKPLF
jgi:hypothetical protein